MHDTEYVVVKAENVKWRDAPSGPSEEDWPDYATITRDNVLEDAIVHLPN